MVADAVSIVLCIFVLIGTGMFLTKIGWIDQGGSKLLSQLVVKVGLCGMIIHKLFTSYTRDSLLNSAYGIGVSYLTLLLALALGYGIARLIKLPKGRRGVFTCMFGFSNSVFIGVPVAQALFGEEVLPYSLLYYIANTTLFWSLGYFMLAKEGGKGEGKLSWKKLIPLPLIVFVLSAALVLLGVKPPKFILTAANYLGNLVTPLSLLYTGYVIMTMIQSGHVRWEKGYAFILLGRFLAAPAIMIALSLVIPMEPIMRNALLIQSSMPVMAQTTIVAGSCGADSEYSAGGITLSTACSLIAIPLYMAVIQNFL